MDLLIAYALQFVGVSYKWGGENPMSGYDCSGFVQEILKSAGVAPPTDLTAQGLFNYFDKIGQIGNLSAGSLVFYGKSATQVTHVGFAIDGYRMIEATGGGPSVVTRDQADKSNAFIRVRPIKSRADYVCAIKPRYGVIGLI